MDTSVFIVERQALQERMHTERMHLTPGPAAKSPSVAGGVLSVAMNLGLLPFLQNAVKNLVIAGVGRWVYGFVQKIKRR